MKQNFIKNEISKPCKSPNNLEEKAINNIGKNIQNAGTRLYRKTIG